MRRYETFVIIDPDLSEDGRKPIINRISELITQQKGLLVLMDEWGSRRLAYEIKTKTRGYYIRFDYCGLGPLVDEIERFCRIEDGVIKYMTVVLNKEVDMDAIQTEITDLRSKAEAAAKEAEEKKSVGQEPLSEASTIAEDESDESEFSNTDEEFKDE